MTTQKKILDLTGSQYLVQKVKSAISDVDSSLSTHIADTDIHVTTADKSKWNNGVSQSYVLRYSSSSVTDNSTIAYSTLDNTDNVKTGDKVIDVNGKIFSIVSVDTANQTVTVGSALIDLALDAKVVHTSGNETVSGQKTFTNDIVVSKNASNMAIFLQNLSYDPKTNGQSGIEGKSCGINFLTSTGDPYININAYGLSDRTLLRLTNSYFTDSQNIDYDSVEFSIYGNGARSFRPKNTSNCDLGESNKQWKGVYATNYYYGANNVEFSTKFVTTDTAQTISGAKTFSEDVVIGNSDTTQSSKRLVLRSYKASLSGSNSDNWGINFNAGASYAVAINAHKSTDGAQGLTYTVRTQDSNNNIFTSSYRFRVFIDGNSVLEPDVDNNVSLGRSTNRWKDCQTYLINGLNPGCLSFPDFSNAIDISSYITVTGGSRTNSTYTPLADGYISVNLGRSSGAIGLVISNGKIEACVRENTFPDNHSECGGFIPVQKNDTVVITSCLADSIIWAYFIPCLGNV